MSSVTQENDLEAFLNTATLAGTDFAAGELLSDRSEIQNGQETD
jgi:hypothetical protein